jgi:hypothetical protein
MSTVLQVTALYAGREGGLAKSGQWIRRESDDVMTRRPGGFGHSALIGQ